MNFFERPRGLVDLLASHDGVQKPRVFISYYHHDDQWYRNQLVNEFRDRYDLFSDSSLEGAIDSSSNDYIRKSIREKNISNTSLTIVLCGPNTPKRKWVDWEISMTLRKQHSLLGIILPNNFRTLLEGPSLPERLRQNVATGYASHIDWAYRGSQLANAINLARSKPKNLIVNNLPEMQRNRS